MTTPILLILSFSPSWPRKDVRDRNKITSIAHGQTLDDILRVSVAPIAPNGNFYPDFHSSPYPSTPATKIDAGGP